MSPASSSLTARKEANVGGVIKPLIHDLGRDEGLASAPRARSRDTQTLAHQKAST